MTMCFLMLSMTILYYCRLLEGAKSRNQVLRLHCVSYLTLTIQQWSLSHLSK